MRPSGLIYRKLDLGLDLPASFYEEIKGIDPNLYFVFHRWSVQYDDLQNQYYGSLEDPRWMIHAAHGSNEVWGWIMTDNKGAPLIDGTWHIWQLKKDYGWSHVANIPEVTEHVLNTLVNRLGREKLYKAKFGHLAWNHKMRKDKEDAIAREQDAKDNRFQDIQRENRSLTRKAMENYERGVFAPTNPTKDVITSYAGQTNRSRIVRGITEKEGGLVTGDE